MPVPVPAPPSAPRQALVELQITRARLLGLAHTLCVPLSPVAVGALRPLMETQRVALVRALGQAEGGEESSKQHACAMVCCMRYLASPLEHMTCSTADSMFG